MRGTTFGELLVGLAVCGVLAALAVPPAARLADRLAVEHEAGRVIAAYQRARNTAWTAMAPVRLSITPARITIVRLRTTGGASDSTVVVDEPGPELSGVALAATPGPVVFAPSGLTVGAANGRYQLERGSVRRAVVVSRLGRLRVER